VAGSEGVIEIRLLRQLSEYSDVLRLQQIVWGFADAELLPMRFLVVVGKVGGHVFGAYDGGRMVGFCFAIPGIQAGGRPYLHSHMLGVLPEYRNRGIGRRLKLRQREDALARGIEMIEWTFDPLELKNAFFNIERLGAIVRRYAVNQYGISASPLHGVLPTDRLVAEWWVASPRASGTGLPACVGVAERISYPADIARIRRDDPECARAIQASNGELFRRAFENGLAVTRFERSEAEGTYVLEPWP
jgi:predicted GNAT superfamily acetyltransferase